MGVKSETNDCGMPTIEDKAKLAQILSDYMKSNGISSAAFVRRTGVSRGSLNNWLDGTVYPQKESREIIAREMGMTIEEFDSQITGIPLEQTRNTVEILQDIRSMPLSDFILVLRVCFERILMELTKLVAQSDQSGK